MGLDINMRENLVVDGKLNERELSKLLKFILDMDEAYKSTVYSSEALITKQDEFLKFKDKYIEELYSQIQEWVAYAGEKDDEILKLKEEIAAMQRQDVERMIREESKGV